jgi:glycine/D-amino acid oxidase-like deaminating enzyme
VIEAKTCLYANSPDGDFIIDFLPGYDRDVVIAAGFSGHGFKFVPVIGEILSDMITSGKATLPIEFLGLKRFASSQF